MLVNVVVPDALVLAVVLVLLCVCEVDVLMDVVVVKVVAVEEELVTVLIVLDVTGASHCAQSSRRRRPTFHLCFRLLGRWNMWSRP